MRHARSAKSIVAGLLGALAASPAIAAIALGNVTAGYSASLGPYTVNNTTIDPFEFTFSLDNTVSQFSFTFARDLPGSSETRGNLSFTEISMVRLDPSPGLINAGVLSNPQTLIVSSSPTFAAGNYTLSFRATESGPGTSQFNLAVAAVPEPHEWAMMLAGLGLVGWAARRNRRGAAGTPAMAAAA